MCACKKFNQVFVKYTGSGQLTHGSEFAAGWDLRSDEYHLLQPGETKIIKTGVYLQMPFDMFAQVVPRSGMASKGIYPMIGTIDSDYRGEIGVILYNGTDLPYRVCVGDRIAQLVFHDLPRIVLNERADLDDSQRSTGGFGSTGV